MKSNYNINKIKDTISLSLDFYKDMSTFEENKNKIADIIKTVEILTNWKDLRVYKGIIEGFFKVAKETFGLG